MGSSGILRKSVVCRIYFIIIIIFTLLCCWCFNINYCLTCCYSPFFSVSWANLLNCPCLLACGRLLCGRLLAMTVLQSSGGTPSSQVWRPRLGQTTHSGVDCSPPVSLDVQYSVWSGKKLFLPKGSNKVLDNIY